MQDRRGLKALQVQLLQILEDKGLPTGSVRRWGGDDFVKKSNGSWQRLPKRKVSSNVRPILPGLPPVKIPVKASPKPAPPKAIQAPVEIPTGRKWVEYVPGMPKNTAAKYTKHGQYTEERQALHNNIMSDFTDHVAPVPEDQQPVALFTMGALASGKSSTKKGLDLSKFVQIDADAIKEKIPEYKQAVEANSMSAAGMVHDESIDVAGKLLRKASKERKNLVWDGTGRVAEAHISKMERLRAMGYRIQLVMTDLDEETGVARAKDRAEKTGRFLPEKLVRDAYRVVPGNFEQIAKYADDVALFDTRNGPRLVHKRTGDQHEDLDPEFMNNFREKHKRPEPKPKMSVGQFMDQNWGLKKNGK